MSPETSAWLERARTIADELDTLRSEEEALQDADWNVPEGTDPLTPIQLHDASAEEIETKRAGLTDQLVGLLMANTNWTRKPDSLIAVTRELLWGRQAARQCHDFAALILKKVEDVDFPRPAEPFDAVHDMREALSEIGASWHTNPSA